MALGRTGVRITRLGVGTAGVGSLPPLEDARAVAVVRRAIDVGITTFDTAPQYGFGRAEERAGRAIAGIPRDELVLTSKVGWTLERVSTSKKVTGVLRDAARDPAGGARLIARRAGNLARRVIGRHPEGGLQRGWPEATVDPTYDGAMRGVEASLRRLGTDRIDLLLLHEPEFADLRTVMDGAYRAIEQLRREGVVRGIGVAPNDGVTAEAYARAGDFDLVLLGQGYTLLDRSAGDSFLPLAEARGLPVIVGGPFASGILADPIGSPTVDHRPATDAERAQVSRLEAVAEAHGVSLRAAALAFPFRHPAVVSVIVGPRSPEEVDDCVALLERPLPAELWAALDDVATPAGGVPARA